MTWLLAKGALGLVRGAWVTIAIIGLGLIAGAIVGTVRGTLDDATELGRNAGEADAVIAGQNQTLDQLGDANHAEQDLRTSGDRSQRRYDGCLRDSDRRAACERYKPLARE